MKKIAIDSINDVLPQTQCGECGFDGCGPYAQALAQGQTTIDRCPPGGVVVLDRLASLLNQDATPYVSDVKNKTRQPSVAKITEADCIGCTKCIQACPVDAIIGTNKHMHTVYEDECTGCGLCVDPCPVDCITMHPIDEFAFDKTLAQRRYQAKQARIAKQQTAEQEHYQQKSTLSVNDQQDQAAKRAYILDALKRKANGNEPS